MATKISIIGGAGTLGSCAAFAIATQGLADEIVMLDTNKNLLKCHIMDIGTAVTGLHDVEIREGSDEDMAGSDIIIVAAGAPWRYISSRMELLNDSMPIIKEIAWKIGRECPEAVVITGTNPVDPLNFAMYLASGIERKKLLGYSLNDSIRFRMMVSKLLGVNSKAVDGIVVGEHGEHQVLLFSTVRVNGQFTSFREEVKQNIKQEITDALRGYESLKTGRTSGWTSAVGFASLIRSVVNNAGKLFPCSAVLQGEYGYERLSATVPVKLGREGIMEIVELDLDPGEEEEFEASMGYLKQVCQAVEKEFSPAGI
ncbi:MAG: hypothetical protein JRJ66_04375 [Deltaproteobacteria bacterium]|nr:hypothetical protein [Deltaproteobacteria bacterium]MBW2044154.1 hypothetical protein [Deltaproteobacteria bacterium]MBW2300539.1 hypothetical protein [Deltaproteobacteria bacterium]